MTGSKRGIGQHAIAMAGTCIATLASCSLFVDTADLSDGASLVDAGVDADGAGGDEPSAEGSAGPGDSAAVELVPHVITAVGNVPAETGMAQQQHLAYAVNAARWWFFYIDDSQPASLLAKWSTDFTTWTSAPARSLSLSLDGEGRNFSVAYASIGGSDVVHSVFSHLVGTTEQVRHARATISDATISYEGGTSVTSATPFDALANPDGCVTAIAADGTIYDASGWYNQKPTTGSDTIGREDVFQGGAQDLGNSWSPSFTHDFSEPASGYVHNRALITGPAGAVLALWPSAETPADTGNVLWSASVSPGENSPVFSGGTGNPTQAMNDWSVCPITATDLHAVRRLLDGNKNDTFEHVRFDTATLSFEAAGTIAADPGKYGSGLVTFTDGKQLLVLAISADTNNSIRSTKWNGSTWSAWTTVVGTRAVRSYLSGSGCNSPKAGIVWTEGANAPYSVSGLDVSSLFE